jgi:hypothetical protein
MDKWITNWIKLMVFVLLCICIVPISVLAGDFDGSKPLLCAVIEVIECSPGGGCQKVKAQEIDIPRFIRINFDKKTISGTLASGKVRATTIEHMEHVDGKLILQGAEDGREGVRDGLGWSMAISEETGDVVLTASGEQVGFVVFGACTPQ